ncbi:unnamed protein product, partial [Closterium sp. NIES-53]
LPRHLAPSQDVTFDESVPYYRLFPYRTAPLPPPPLFLAPGAAVVDPLPPQGAAPSGVSQVDPVEPVEVAVDSRPAASAESGGAESGGAVPGGAEPGGAESGGAVPGGAEPGGAESGGAVPGGAEPGGAEPWGAESGGAVPGSAEPGGAESGGPESGGPESGGPVPESPTPGGALSSEQLREWYLQYCRLRRGTSGAGRTTGVGAGTSPPRRELPSRDQIRAWYERRCTLRSGAPGVTDPGATGAAAGAEDPGDGTTTGALESGVGAAAGAGDPGVGAATGAADPGAGAATGAVESSVGAAAGAGDPGVGAAAGAEDPGTGDSAGSGVAARRRPYFVPLLQQVLDLPSSTSPPPPLEFPQPVSLQLQFQPASPLPAPSPYTGPTGGLAQRREPASRPTSPVRAARTSGRGSSQRPPPVPGTHRMPLRPSTAPLRAPLPSPPESSLPTLSDPESDFLRAASPTVARLLATVVLPSLSPPHCLSPPPATLPRPRSSPGAARGAETGGAETGRAEPGGLAPEGTVSGGAEPARAAPGGALGVPSPREPLSPQRLREWYSRRCRFATGAGAAGVAGGAAGVPGGADATGGPAGAGAAGGAAGATGGAAGAEGTGSVSAVSGGAARPRPYFVPLLQQVLGSPPSPGPPPPPFLRPSPVQSQSQLQPASPLPGPSPYSGPTRGLTERTHSMTLRPSTAPQRVPLPSPPASSLPDGPDPESDSLRAARPFVTRFLATAVTDPLFESSAASALVAELVDFAAACRLDYAASLVTESVSASVCPPSVGGECALGTDVLEDRQEDLECFAASSPHLVSMLLVPEGDPDALDIPTPRSYVEAIEGPYSSQWQAVMDAEMASWKSTGTYVDEVPPPGANIVSGMWIFRVKRPPGSPPAFKARYVARGFSQRQGVDFFQTFSPTPKMTTLRVVLHVAAQRDYELHSLDFSTAFLQGSLHEEIWLRRPPGFTESFPTGTHWSLQRPVYGLRQAPREWHDTLRTTLASLGFAPSTTDPSLFLRTDATLPPFYILVYVDDLVFATADTEALALVKSELQKRHTCTDLGELTSYLGLRITRDRAQRTITLTQSHMVQQVLQRFGFTYSSPQSTPLPTGHSLSAPPSDKSVEPSGLYPELVGCLMYLMTCTRPDLAYPLSLLARYVAPGRHRKVHWDAPKRVLRYLCSTSGMGLVLGGRDRVVLTGHADASWVDDLATQRSSQGYTFSLGSGSVSWRSTRSSSVLSSSCEAEIYAGAMAAQELRWLTYLLTDLGEVPRSPPVLYVDNKAMLALCQEHRLEHRTKHIALRYFLARELQQRGQLRLAYVASQANTADVFTKAVQPCDHQ